MGKSVLHYRRKMEALAGRAAHIRAWRNSAGQMAYQIRCLLCPSGNRWKSDGWALGRPVKTDFHSVLREWATHMRLDHESSPDLPTYPVEISDDMRARHAEARRWAKLFAQSD